MHAKDTLACTRFYLRHLSGHTGKQDTKAQPLWPLCYCNFRHALAIVALFILPEHASSFVTQISWAYTLLD